MSAKLLKILTPLRGPLPQIYSGQTQVRNPENQNGEGNKLYKT